MGTRVKNFESTGIAPNGRLYAGDLNAIQDQYADQRNFAQTIDLANLRIGEESIQLLRYGASEARLSAALRTDGILRPLGGLALAALTTAQRDALTAAQRPYGLFILNTSFNRLEWNSGSSAAPVWTSIVQGTLPDPEVVGVIKMYGGDYAPAGYLMCDGSEIHRGTFINLFNVFGTRFGAGDGGSTFNLPDFRGRIPAGTNTGNPYGDHHSVGNNDGNPIWARRVRHRHTVNDGAHRHESGGWPDRAARPFPGHGNYMDIYDVGGNTGWSYSGISVGPQSGYEPVDTSSFLTVNFIVKV